jgi:hypothetical protein
MAEVIARHLDAASEQMTLYKSGKIKDMAAIELFKKLKKSRNDLTELNDKSPRVDLAQAIESLDSYIKEVSAAVLK